MEKTSEKKRIKGRWWIAIVIAVAVYLALAIHDKATNPLNYWNFHSFYLSDTGYAKALEVTELEYEAFVERYGPPIRKEELFDEQENACGFTAHYQGFSINCIFWEWELLPEDRSIPHLDQVTITDRRFRFGRLQIGVGSSREQIHTAYRFDKQLSQDLLQRDGEVADEAYCADYWRKIMFNYDESGLVESMRIGARVF